MYPQIPACHVGMAVPCALHSFTEGVPSILGQRAARRNVYQHPGEGISFHTQYEVSRCQAGPLGHLGQLWAHFHLELPCNPRISLRTPPPPHTPCCYPYNCYPLSAYQREQSVLGQAGQLGSCWSSPWGKGDIQFPLSQHQGASTKMEGWESSGR